MKFIAITIVILISTTSVFAKYIQTCKAKYRVDYGWSKYYYTVDVIFMTGYELNQATKTFVIKHLNSEQYRSYFVHELY